MTTTLSTFTDRVHALNQEYQLLFQRSLVDLALSDRHEYWDVETLEEAIDNIGFPAIIRELQGAGQSLSNRVLIQAIHQTALQVQSWTEETVRYRFLTLWRERCQDYGWEEMARQCEGLMFDYRMPSLQRKVTIDVYPKQRMDATRIGLLSTRDGQWLLDVGRDGIRTWDTNTGEEGPFWSVNSLIDFVCIDEAAQVLISTREGGLYRWDVLFQVHQELTMMELPLQALTNRAGKIAGWSGQQLYIWDDDGQLRLELPAKFRHTPTIALSADGHRIMACDGSTLGVWSTITGGVIFGLGFHTGLSIDDVNRVESILDLARTELGLRLMDKLDLWGLKLSRQYDTIQGFSVPMVMSDSDTHVVMGEGDQLAWLEWDGVLEEYVVSGDLRIDDVWSFQQVKSIASTARTIVCQGNDGLIAIDFQRQKVARYPLTMPLASKLCVLENSGLIACDDTQKVSFFLFRAD